MNRKFQPPVVVIVGCGPAGLLAAEAAYTRGYEPIILGGARPVMSKIHGAQYLHRQIPGLCTDDDSFTVTYVKHGTDIGYAAKVYGPGFDAARTSWSKFPAGPTRAWSLERVYQMLWNMYEHRIYPVDFSMALAPMFLNHFNVSKIISTMPLNRLQPHLEFFTETVLVDDTRCRSEVGYNEIHYYGDDAECYRSSWIGAHKSIEYPSNARLTGPAAVAVEKPLSFAGAPDPRVNMVGRYGQWQKGVLVDDAYERTLSLLRPLG